MNIVKQRLIFAMEEEDRLVGVVKIITAYNKTTLGEYLCNNFSYGDFIKLVFSKYSGDINIVKKYLGKKSQLKKDLVEEYYSVIKTTVAMLTDTSKSADFIKQQCTTLNSIEDIEDKDTVATTITEGMAEWLNKLTTETIDDALDILKQMEETYNKQVKDSEQKDKEGKQQASGLKVMKSLLSKYGADINDNFYNVYSNAMVQLYQSKYPKANDAQLEKYYAKSNEELDGFLNDVFSENISQSSLNKLLSSENCKGITKDSSKKDVEVIMEKAISPIIKNWLNKLKRNIKQNYPLPQL